MKTGIRPTPEFLKKKLASHSANCGLLCGHNCTYCSTAALIRTHPIFQEIGRSAFTEGLVVVDPNTVLRVARDASRLKAGDVVQVCTTTDGWAPESQELGLGRGILEALFENSDCRVRVLTKNAAVSKDFDLIEKYRDRVFVGLSLTAPPSRSRHAGIIEPHASSIEARLGAYEEAHRLGLQTYGMLCPCLPGIADDEASLREMAEAVLACGADEIWAEPVNARGNGLKKTEAALREAGESNVADAVQEIRNQKAWSRYARRFIEQIVAVAQDLRFIGRLHVLLYPKGLLPEDRAALEPVPGIVWLE